MRTPMDFVERGRWGNKQEVQNDLARIRNTSVEILSNFLKFQLLHWLKIIENRTIAFCIYLERLVWWNMDYLTRIRPIYFTFEPIDTELCFVRRRPTQWIKSLWRRRFHFSFSSDMQNTIKREEWWGLQFVEPYSKDDSSKMLFAGGGVFKWCLDKMLGRIKCWWLPRSQRTMPKQCCLLFPEKAENIYDKFA